MGIADGRKMKERGKTGGRRDAREVCAGGPNPPAARTYRSYKNFSRNNLQRLENRLIDCPTHDFACKQTLRDAFSRKDRLARTASSIPMVIPSLSAKNRRADDR